MVAVAVSSSRILSLAGRSRIVSSLQSAFAGLAVLNIWEDACVVNNIWEDAPSQCKVLLWPGAPSPVLMLLLLGELPRALLLFAPVHSNIYCRGMFSSEWHGQKEPWLLALLVFIVVPLRCKGLTAIGQNRSAGTRTGIVIKVITSVFQPVPALLWQVGVSHLLPKAAHEGTLASRQCQTPQGSLVS